MDSKPALAALLALVIVPVSASAYPQEELKAALVPLIIAASLIISLALFISKSKRGRKMFTEAKEVPLPEKAVQRKTGKKPKAKKGA